MQPRFFFAAVGSGHLRSFTNFTKPKCWSRISDGEITAYVAPGIGRGSVRIDHKTRRMNTPLKHWKMWSSDRPRCMTTSGIAHQDDAKGSQDLGGVLLLSAPTSVSTTETGSTFSLPSTNNRSRLRRITSTRKTLRPKLKATFQNRNRYRSRRSIKRSVRRRILNPLSMWLDSTLRSGRARIWMNEFRKRLYEPKYFALPTVLQCYLEAMEASAAGKRSSATALNISEVPALQRSGFKPEDVILWAHVLSASSNEEAAHRFVASKSRMPTFVLLEILRRPYLSTKSFRSLLIYSSALSGLKLALNPRQSAAEIADATSIDQALPLFSTANSANHSFRSLELSTFQVLTCRLIRQARHLSPSSLVTIANMIVAYCRHLSPTGPDVSLPLHAKLCRMYNMMLFRFSLPASVQPMKSMTYNWEAQRRLLLSAAEFKPPLLLDRNSYRAVSRVLLACHKSSLEKRYASLMQRTWPPWRKELDGMDVNRSPEEDTSRVVAAVSRMKESGYAQDANDSAVNILGGREADGTPTIQTRQIKKPWKHIPSAKGCLDNFQDRVVEWAARITATRDVYEAWEAFQSYKRDGRRPSHSMYQAMFEKIIYRKLTSNLPQSHEALAGDAREPLPVLDDNMSESEKLRKQPPSVDILFSQMTENGVRPYGRCLDMLVSNAPTLEKVALYMHHGTVPSHTLASLLCKPEMMQQSSLNAIPHGTFSAFIRFLCRSRRWMLTTPQAIFNAIPVQGRRESIADFKHHSDPVIHAFELLRYRRPSNCAVWYHLFRALTKRGFVLDDNRDQLENDEASWQLLEVAVRELENTGVSLDPDGFRHICIGLEKAIVASRRLNDYTASSITNGPELVKEIFASLAESMEVGDGLPRLLYTFSGHHLHPYIRLLGVIQDVNEVILVLGWMAKHQDELTRDAKLPKNGLKLLRRSLVAARALFDHHEARAEEVEQLRAIMVQLDQWGGWPTDEEVEHYLARERTLESLEDREEKDR